MIFDFDEIKRHIAKEHPDIDQTKNISNYRESLGNLEEFDQATQTWKSVSPEVLDTLSNISVIRQEYDNKVLGEVNYKTDTSGNYVSEKVSKLLQYFKKIPNSKLVTKEGIEHRILMDRDITCADHFGGKFDDVKNQRSCPCCKFTKHGEKSGHAMNRHIRYYHHCIQCLICGDIFDIDGLQSHMKAKHSEVLMDSSDGQVTEEKFYTFSTDLDDWVEMDLQDVEEMTIKKQKRVPISLKYKHMPKTLTCPKCPQTFTNKYYRQIHVKQVHSKIRCEECDKELSRGHYRHHVQTKHSKKFSHVCDQCGAQFVAPCDLRNHVDEVHIKEIKHFCEACGKGFFSRVQLTRHKVKFHPTNPEPEGRKQCPYCGLTYLRMSGLRKHVGQVHPDKYKPGKQGNIQKGQKKHMWGLEEVLVIKEEGVENVAVTKK